MSLARRTLVAQNPEGTPTDQVRCPYYHPLYCITLGHNDYRNDRCDMTTKGKEERAAALKIISADQLDVEVNRKYALVGMYFLKEY